MDGWVGGCVGSNHHRCENTGTADTEYMRTSQNMREFICENWKPYEKEKRRVEPHIAQISKRFDRYWHSELFSVALSVPIARSGSIAYGPRIQSRKGCFINLAVFS